MHRYDYHPELEVGLLARHVCDAHVAGKIDGMLAVLANLNNSDATLVFVADERAWLLGLGWSD